MIPTDPALPALPVLLGDDASELLDAALSGAGTVTALTPRMLQYRPGRRISVAYGTNVEWGDGRTTTETLVAVSGVDGPPAGAVVLEAGDLVVGCWRYPADPGLPGLPAAADPAAVRRVFDRLGAPAGEVALQPVSYRPERRAVLHAAGAGRDLFVKVVRPSAVAGLHRAHTALAARVPVPRSFGWSDAQGLVTLEAFGGDVLRDRLFGKGELPDPEELFALLDLVAQVDLDAPPRITTAQAAAFHSSVLAHIVPDEAERVAALAAPLASEPTAPDAIVHGDFYEAQVVLRGDAEHAPGGVPRSLGLLDVDGAGPGQRVDDVATLVGHLLVLALVWPPTRERVQAYADAVVAAAASRWPPDALRRRVGAVLLAMATGPFQLWQETWPDDVRERLDLAAEWLGP